MKNLWKRIRKWWLTTVWWKIATPLANRRIKPGGKKRSEAEEQLARVIYETGIRPDAIAATTMRGAPAFDVRHDEERTITIDRTYTAAADEAIAWLKEQQGNIKPQKHDKAPVMSRSQRRGFDKRLRGEKRGTPAHFQKPPRKKKRPKRGKR